MRINLSPFSLFREVTGGLTGKEPESVHSVNKFYETMAPILEIYERQWYLNIANIMGNQWLL